MCFHIVKPLNLRAFNLQGQCLGTSVHVFRTSSEDGCKMFFKNVIKTFIFLFLIQVAAAFNTPATDTPSDRVAEEIQRMSDLATIRAEETKTYQNINFYQMTLRQLGRMGPEQFGGNYLAYNQAMDSTELKISELRYRASLLQKRERELSNN